MSTSIEKLVWKTANIEDRLTGRAVEEFKFRKVGGGVGRTTVPRSDLLEPGRLLKHLIDHNAALTSAHEQAITKIANDEPRRYVIQPQRMGWQNNGQGFLAATGAVGDCGSREVALPSWMTKKHAIVQSKRGTLEGWIERVAGPSCHSSAALVALCAAFAAPLLRVTRTTPFGINLYGVSKAGKTSALLAAASVGGIGIEGRMPNFRSTAAARGELGCAFNDQLLPLNEVGLLAQRNRAYDAIRELIYQMSEGRDTIRHTESKYAKAAKAAEFRTVFVSTSEHHFDRYARFAQQHRDEGEYARCLDVSACARGGSTIMDLVPDDVEANDRRAWRRKQVISLRRSCASHHGHALPAYIEFLISRGDELKKAVGNLQKDFISQIDIDGLEGALQHAAHNFSLLVTGGMLAIRAKLLPLREEELMAIMREVFGQSISEINIFQTPERTVRQILRKELANLKKFASDDSFSAAGNTEGFCRIRNGQATYTVSTRAFQKWFKNDSRLIDSALGMLADRKKLKEPNRRKNERKRQTLLATYTKTITWPAADKIRRSLVFKDPFFHKPR
jgi:5-methylcytosine-specific restriction endonuclease McrA